MPRPNKGFHSHRKGWQTLFVLGVLVAMRVQGSASQAATGSAQVVPRTMTGKKIFSRQSGLQLEVDTTWAGTEGYRPIRISLSSAKPVPAEVLVTIRVSVWGSQNLGCPMAVEK